MMLLKLIIMNRTFLFLVAFLLISVNISADGLTATLQQGDKMVPFYGVDAFMNAYADADSGAVITLSAGSFKMTSDSIKKAVKIVGNFGLGASSVERTILPSMTIIANNVTVDGVFFTGNLVLGNIDGCKIMHSWIEGTLKYSSIKDWHANTIVDQCVIKTEAAIKQGKNYTIKNSTINQFSEYNSKANIAFISNCLIYDFVYSRYSVVSHSSGEINALTPIIPFAVYKNNILGVNTVNYHISYTVPNYYYNNTFFDSPCEFWYNKFAILNYVGSASGSVRSVYNNQIVYNAGCQNSGNEVSTWGSVITSTTYPSNPTSPGNGQDGTVRGPMGGTGFSLYPNIPRITSSKIDSYTDNDGKLNVTIKVAVPE
jgi:hypothetical protein